MKKLSNFITQFNIKNLVMFSTKNYKRPFTCENILKLNKNVIDYKNNIVFVKKACLWNKNDQ